MLQDIDKTVNLNPPGIENLKVKYECYIHRIKYLQEEYGINKHVYAILESYLYERFYHLYWLSKYNEVSK